MMVIKLLPPPTVVRPLTGHMTGVLSRPLRYTLPCNPQLGSRSAVSKKSVYGLYIQTCPLLSLKSTADANIIIQCVCGYPLKGGTCPVSSRGRHVTCVSVYQTDTGTQLKIQPPF